MKSIEEDVKEFIENPIHSGLEPEEEEIKRKDEDE